MVDRRGDADRAAWTLVLVAAALLALDFSIGLVSPRSRPATGPQRALDAVAEHEPLPSPLVAPRSPRANGVNPSARVSPAKETTWKAGDAGHEQDARGPASDNHAPELAMLEIRVTRAGRAEPGAAIEIVHEPSAPGPEGSASPALHASDEDGLLKLQLAPGSVRAVAWSTDACALPASAALATAAPARIELALEPAFPVAGRVIDAVTGAPLAGATVALWTFAERDTVTTAADGSFLHPRFPGRAPAQQIAARATGHGVSACYLRIAADGRWKIAARTAGEQSLQGSGTPWVELALVPELRVRGRAVDAGGRPLAGARVSAEGFYHVRPSVASRDRAVGTSAADGLFELAGLRSDIGHSLLIEALGCAHELLELESDATELDLGTLVLAREVVLAGAAVDYDGRPLAGVEVVLRTEPAATPAERPGTLDVPARIQGRELRVTTSTDGTFLFEHLAPRPVTLTLEHPDGARAELELAPRPDGTFESPCLTLSSAPLFLAERTAANADGEN